MFCGQTSLARKEEVSATPRQNAASLKQPSYKVLVAFSARMNQSMPADPSNFAFMYAKPCLRPHVCTMAHCAPWCGAWQYYAKPESASFVLSRTDWFKIRAVQALINANFSKSKPVDANK